nr:carbohydrate-binding family 9-like protein [uncultured Flavobacterium sp.]
MSQILKEYQVNFIEKKTPYFDEAFWKKANCLTDFCSPWEKGEFSKIEFRALWNLETLFFKFTVFDTDVYIDTTDESFKSISKSDRVELFFRTNQDINPYYCLEMDSAARIMDFKAFPNRNFDVVWKWPKTDLQVRSSNDTTSFSVEGEISLKSLKALDLIKNDTLEVGVFRAKFNRINDLQYKPTWITWVDPETADPNFHIASSFGRFILIK